MPDEKKKEQRRRRGGIRNRGSRDRPVWYCNFTESNGQRKEIPTHQSTKEGALEYLAAIKSRIARGLVGIPTPTEAEKTRSRITVGELVALFLGDVEGEPGHRPPSLHSLDTYRIQVRSICNARVLPEFGNCAAASIRRIDIEKWRDEQLVENYAASSVGQSIAYLQKILNWAKRQEMIDCANPCVGVEFPPIRPRLDYYSAAEIGSCLALAEARAVDEKATYEDRMRYPWIAVATYAGLRKGELFGLVWRDVHLDAGRLDVQRSGSNLVTKGGRDRHVPINGELAPILRAWRDRCPDTAEGLVFPVEAAGQFRMGTREDMMGLPSLLEAAGCHVPDRPVHAFRHSFASHFMMSGGNLLTLSKLLGHASIEMTMVYAHLSPDHLALEVARMSFPRPSAAGVIDLGAARAAAEAKALEAGAAGAAESERAT